MTKSSHNGNPVLCFGEILWDFLPGGPFPGGAPFNVAYHLHRLGAAPLVVSAVGCDELGDELLRRLRAWGLPADGITRHDGVPTGRVTAVLGERGDASYEIATHVAWDQITVDENKVHAAAMAAAVVFGSLAQRSPANRGSLDRLLAVLPSTALRVFDVNLRPPHDDPALVRALARRANVLKLNADEAARLAVAPAGWHQEETHARVLAAATGCEVICITAGAVGAGLLRDHRWLWEPGRPVEVADTVGAGDAFLAALLAGWFAGKDDRTALAHACRIGEWVATQRGATPDYTTATPR